MEFQSIYDLDKAVTSLTSVQKTIKKDDNFEDGNCDYDDGHEDW